MRFPGFAYECGGRSSIGSGDDAAASLALTVRDLVSPPPTMRD